MAQESKGLKRARSLSEGANIDETEPKRARGVAPTLRRLPSEIRLEETRKLQDFSLDDPMDVSMAPIELVDDCLLLVFRSLRRSDLASCALVNKQFLRVALSEELGWVDDFITLYLGLQTIKDGLKRKRPTRIAISKASPGHFELFAGSVRLEEFAVLDMADCWSLGEFNDVHEPVYMEGRSKFPLEEALANPGLFRLRFGSIQNDFLLPLVGKVSACETFIDFNARRFEKLVRSGESIPLSKEVLSTIAFEISREASTWFDRYDFTDPFRPMDVVELPEQPEGFKEGLTLHKYQLEALAWMKSIEQSSSIGVKYCSLAAWRRGMIGVLFDVSTESPSIAVEGHTHTLTYRGGILADEMGLGKTTEVIALALANPATDADLSAVDSTQDPENTLYKTKATLIVVPSTIASQWAEQIKENTGGKAKVFLITTMKEHKDVSYGDIIDADFVVVSAQFLENPTYFKLGTTSKETIKKDTYLSRRTWVSNYLGRVKRSKEPLANKNPIFDNFYWHRIVLDEGNETLQMHLPSKVIGDTASRNRWYVSGTPFPHKNLGEPVAQFLDLRSSDPNFYPFRPVEGEYNPRAFERYPRFLKHVAIDVMIAKLLWRNTKESAGDSVALPKAVEELVLLDFSPIERALYDIEDGNREAQEDMCSMVPTPPAVDWKRMQAEAAAAEAAGEPLDTTPKLPEGLLNQLRRRSLDDAEDFAKRDQKGNSTRVVNRVSKAKAALEAAKVSGADAEKEELELARATEKLEEHERGQKRAKAALDLWKKVGPMRVPPSLKGQFQESSTVEEPRLPSLIRTNSAIIKANISAEIEPLVFQYGTKLANLVFYLKTMLEGDPQARFIVFSQNIDFLYKVSGLLSNLWNIASSFVEGNVVKKNKALKNFKDEDVRVMLLSLTKTASGTHLVVASHVILADTVFGDRREAEALESQAIARAYRQGQTKDVTVVRFVVKDTFEHALFTQSGPYQDEEGNVKRKTKAALPRRVHSIAALLAESKSLSATSVVGMLEGSLDSNASY